MSNKVSVERVKGGAWAVTKENDSLTATATYKSKVEAVTSARATSPQRKLAIHTATGQVVRPPDVKTTKPKNVMRDAVLEVVQRREKK